MKKKNQDDPMKSDLILYHTEDGKTRIEVHLQDETVWLSQKLMAELFQKDVRTINEHIKNIFEEGELAPESVIRKFRITAADGKNYDTAHYNLDVIISVGYRVKSHRGTQFRIWATQRLREYIVKLSTSPVGTGMGSYHSAATGYLVMRGSGVRMTSPPAIA
ncbi:MAG: hypothetical protein CO150_03480 [Nitrospirae bacterium CG_4_9_14_3_um_filter_53_35]|nr:MAG: hypothetical protein COW52_05440 [Nitrospirae bacterium CG17_big_fil_post_rev_8_21_14_2_50_50_9]PJA76348.1 MAG: hypothetical protein CO150_03480 [Nitrospirae bacterium CG_4_9_14_3_um_filter_53_35]